MLRESPGALHVRLYGRREARVERAMRLESLTREEAERRLTDNDRAREAYVHHFYGADPNDLRHYHLAIDSTEIDLDRCVDLIAAAAERTSTALGGEVAGRATARASPPIRAASGWGLRHPYGALSQIRRSAEIGEKCTAGPASLMPGLTLPAP